MITSTEFFINMKSVPDRSSKEYKAFFKNERDKIKYGITINGVRIPGWLYWHVNHWNIDIDQPPIGGYVERKPGVPYLRDNEWLIAEHIERAEKQHKGLLILGSRQLGKSEFGASYEARAGISFQNSQNVIAGLSTSDLELLLSKLDRGFTRLHPAFRPIKIRRNEKLIKLGYKNKTNEDVVWSEYLIRNMDAGKNPDNLAGPTTTTLFIDEIGKGDFLEAFISAKPALETPYGWRGTPIFVGTSGTFDKAEDLERFRENLDTYNFLEIEMKDEKNNDIFFIPGWRSSKTIRKKIRFSTFLKVKKGSELDDIPIHVVENPEAEIQKIKAYRKSLEDANEKILLKKETMFYPLDEEELFLTDDSDNVFSDVKELAKNHLKYLEEVQKGKFPDQKYLEEYGWMTRDSTTGKPRFVKASGNECPISTFPTDEKENKDAPIIIWSHPLEGQEFGVLHVAGGDPYNQEEASTSPSLGTLYIYRRTYDPLKGTMQESFVASYSARPKNENKWFEQVRLLLEYYGATCLPENEDRGLIRYFDQKHISHYLENGIDLAKEINPETETKRNKGLAATTPNIRYGNGVLKDYLMEDLVMGQDKDGNPIIKKGVVRIKDKMLLKEIIEYKPKMSIKVNPRNTLRRKKRAATNVDRIVAARHALILARAKDKFYPVAKVTPQTEPSKPVKRQIKSPFGKPVNPFGGGFKSSPF